MNNNADHEDSCLVGGAPSADDWDKLIGKDGPPGSTTHSKLDWLASLDELDREMSPEFTDVEKKALAGCAQAVLSEASAKEVQLHEWKLRSDNPSGKGSSVSVNQEEAVAKAEAAGFEVIRADDNTILLDIDDGEALKQYERMQEIVTRHIPFVESERWASKDGGLHVKLRLDKPVTATERLLLQACLGSDPVKEFLGMVRLREGQTDPTLLFKPKVGG